jgi:hypothetical protein
MRRHATPAVTGPKRAEPPRLSRHVRRPRRSVRSVHVRAHAPPHPKNQNPHKNANTHPAIRQRRRRARDSAQLIPDDVVREVVEVQVVLVVAEGV